jgi:hypothetical protein
MQQMSETNYWVAQSLKWKSEFVPDFFTAPIVKCPLVESFVLFGVSEKKATGPAAPP